MTKDELLQKISNTPELKGIVIDDFTSERRNGVGGQVVVSGYYNTPDWQKTKEVLVAMGFNVGAGAADVLVVNGEVLPL